MSLMVHEDKCCQLDGYSQKKPPELISRLSLWETGEYLLPSLTLLMPARCVLVCWMVLHGMPMRRGCLSWCCSPDVARGPHLSKQCRWFLQRSCILWSMGRKMTGVGQCLLINLEEAKTPIQHVETFETLSTCCFQIWGRKKRTKPTNNRNLQVLQFFKAM